MSASEASRPSALRSPGPASSGEQAPRCLVFRLERGRYAISLPTVSGFGDVGKIRRVPGASAAVLGLVEWRGRLLTVIDLPPILGEAAHGDAACLVRLAPPHDHLAFHIPAVVLVRDVGQEEGAPRRLLDPALLIRGLGERTGG